MNYSNKLDGRGHELAKLQSTLFRESLEYKIPSFYFIRAFMNSTSAKNLDRNNIDSSFSPGEVFAEIRSKTNMKNGTYYSELAIEWIGYVYRSISYMYGISSKALFKKLSPSYLIRVYPMYHTQSVEKAIILIDENIHFISKNNDRMQKILMFL